MIHIIPGFLGREEDFEFLQEMGEIKIYDLRSLDIPSIMQSVQPNDILIGYSMGGRVAMEVAERINFQFRKLILLASHPGLQLQSEKDERKIWEDLVLKKMNESGFFNWWNSLPLFSSDRPLEEQNLNQWIEVFNTYRLSKQKNFTVFLSDHTDKIFYLYGAKDEKFSKIAEETLIPLNIRCKKIEAGHRVFQHQEALLGILREEVL
jgi:2-succinyl-6-hydroxy-2,4-cyclohexadiene-1-carboxylate synthase